MPWYCVAHCSLHENVLKQELVPAESEQKALKSVSELSWLDEKPDVKEMYSQAFDGDMLCNVIEIQGVKPNGH